MEQLPKVFPLKCAVQKYLWGKVGIDSEVAKLSLSADSTFEVDENTTYAELWMGTHPNGPSRIISSSGDADIDLGAWVKKNADSIGKDMEKDKELSFLFKVLSVKTALSIQAHPDLVLAEKIHQEKPEIYKDPNHKPEMAIALTPFKGLCGFRPIKEVAGFLQHIEELRTAVGGQHSVKLVTASKCMDPKAHREAMKACFTGLMNQKKEIIHSQLSSLINRVIQDEKDGKDISRYEKDVLFKLNKEFPGDVGCFAIYFLNIVNLKPGEAMFLRASLPHAYLSGDCIECMACSDNTIRAGLTSKLRDVDLLCTMLDYSSTTVAQTKFRPLQRGDVTYYKPDIEDFMVTKVQEDLDNVQSVWDVHPFEYKKNSGGVVGKPFLFYNSPEMFRTDDKLCSVDADDFDACKEQLGIIQNTHCDPNLEELCQIVMEENNRRMPDCSAEAVQLYLNLRSSILTSL